MRTPSAYCPLLLHRSFGGSFRKLYLHSQLYTVNQKNQNLQVILRKIKGMINRKFVRVIFIEGLPEQDAVGKRWLEQLAKSTNTAFVVIEIHDEEAELSLD